MVQREREEKEKKKAKSPERTVALESGMIVRPGSALLPEVVCVCVCKGRENTKRKMNIM